MVHVESWKRDEEGRGGDPPVPPPNGPGGGGGARDDEGNRAPSPQVRGGQDSVDVVMEDEAGELEEVDSTQLNNIDRLAVLMTRVSGGRPRGHLVDSVVAESGGRSRGREYARPEPGFDESTGREVGRKVVLGSGGRRTVTSGCRYRTRSGVFEGGNDGGGLRGLSAAEYGSRRRSRMMWRPMTGSRLGRRMGGKEVGGGRAGAAPSGGRDGDAPAGVIEAYGRRTGRATGGWGSGPEAMQVQESKHRELHKSCMKMETGKKGLGMRILSLTLMDRVCGEGHSAGPEARRAEALPEKGFFLESLQRSQPIKISSILKSSVDLVDPTVRGGISAFITGGGVDMGKRAGHFAPLRRLSGCNTTLITGGGVVMGTRAWHFAPLPSPRLGFRVLGVMGCGWAQLLYASGVWAIQPVPNEFGCGQETSAFFGTEILPYSDTQQAPVSVVEARFSLSDKVERWEMQVNGTESQAKSGDSVDLLVPRTSKRLADAKKTSVLDRAMFRKANQREVGEGSGGTSTVKKLLRKSRLCGVKLEDSEAKEFAVYLHKHA